MEKSLHTLNPALKPLGGYPHTIYFMDGYDGHVITIMSHHHYDKHLFKIILEELREMVDDCNSYSGIKRAIAYNANTETEISLTQVIESSYFRSTFYEINGKPYRKGWYRIYDENGKEIEL